MPSLGQADPPSKISRGLRDLLLGLAVYFISARLGLLFAIFDGGVSAVWPPSGLALGLAVALGTPAAIGAGIGAILSDCVTHGRFSLLTPVFGLGAALECWVGARLLRWRGFERRMPRVRDVLTLVVFGALVAPLVSAAIGSISLRLAGYAPHEALLQVFRTWWVGDALGVLSFTPVLLAFLDSSESFAPRPELHEALTAGGMLFFSTVGVFLLPQAAWLASGMLVFATVPLLAIVWIALRFDQRAAAAAMLFLAGAAILGTATAQGAFGRQAPADRVWLLQMYLVLCALTTFTIAALVADGRARHQKLALQDEQLRRTSQLAQVGGFSWGLTELPRWSPQLHAIFRIPEDEPPLTLQDTVEVMLPEDAARYQSLLERIRRAPEAYSFSFSFRRRDGAIRHAQAIAEPLFDANHKLIRWDGAVQDITERVAAENQLREMERVLQQSQRLESLGLLAGGVAHDFNNLLTGILANAAYVQSAVKADPRLSSALGDVEGAAHAAADLCRQMLTFAGRSRPVLERLQLSKLVSETSQLLSRSIKKSARVVFELASDLPFIDGDSAQLRQVTMNLLMNASDALGESGTVTVRAETSRCLPGDLSRAMTQVDLTGRDCVVLSVEDNGCGMSEETLARIFQPFFTTKAKGRGLGLAATLGIVQQHGGALVVSSAPGKGTRFALWFPVADSQKEPAARDSFLLKGTALVADDDPAILRVAVRLLEAAGVVVKTASTVEEARVLVAQGGEFSFALVDQHLEQQRGQPLGSGSGLELIRALKRERPGLPCVMLTSIPDDPAARALLEGGHTAVLLKPFRPETLREAVKSASLA